MLHTILFWLGAFTAIFFVGVFVELGIGGSRLRRLHQIPPLPDAEMPSVSIIVAARNEERAIEHALGSLLRQRGGGMEVIVVDDRSDDSTGAILDRMAAVEPRLRVVHVTDLPRGWLGKNHALWMGAQSARGELLLFTDADIVMAPDAVARAAGYLSRERLDHLTVAPHVNMPGRLLTAFGVVFTIFFSLYTRPWRVRDPRSKQHVGIGAFNLVRADSYRRMGTHRAIAMRPDDDVKLGKLVKKNGMLQDFVLGPELVQVEWYSSIPEAVRGLRKNGFAGVDYRISLVVLATAVHVVFFIWPFIAVFATRGWTQAFYGFALLMILGLYAGSARAQKSAWWHGILFPIASVLFIVVIWNATIYALVNRGIEWRGTHYPLDELRANRI
jgi:cellulose synthase/poly-beta-1,6-N-acetylglucosamine synthase-like glycosyltransferase